jgi:hypothetical protein
MKTQTMKEKYQAEIDRLDAEHAGLAKLWIQVPWFALTALLAPVAGLVWGWGAAVVELLVSGALVGTRAYLVAVRMTENRWIRDKLLADMQAQDEQLAPTPVERSLVPTRVPHSAARSAA